MKKNTWLLVALIAVVISVIGCAPSAPTSEVPKPTTPAAPSQETKPIELKLSHNSSTASASHAGVLEPWAKAVEKASNGKVKITIYPSETLNKAKEAIQAAQSGITDITWALVSFFPGRFPLSEVNTLPFMTVQDATINGRKLSAGAINSRITQELFEQFPEIQAEWKGVKSLIQHTSAPQQIWTSKKPVRKAEDVKGLKIRAAASPDVELWKALGAAPLLMPLPEVYESAQKGVVDGGITDFSGIASYRLYEVFRYTTDDALVTIGRYSLIMNEAKWNSLPPDVQKAIMSVSGVPGAEMAGDGMFYASPGLNAIENVRNKAKEAGKPLEEVMMDPGELDKIKLAAQPIYEKWIADMAAKGLPGQKVFDALRALLTKYSSK